jgi:hypothetical protein
VTRATLISLSILLVPAVSHAESLDAQAPPVSTDTADVRLAVDLGLGSLEVAGKRVTAVTSAVNLDSYLRISPHLAIGLRVAKSIGIHPTVAVIPPPIGPAIVPIPDGPWRSVPWLVEPAILARATPLRAPWFELALVAGAGLGVSNVQSQVLCSGCVGVDMSYRPERHLEPSASAIAGAQLTVAHVEAFLGTRTMANGAGDVAVALDAAIGAAW